MATSSKPTHGSQGSLIAVVIGAVVLISMAFIGLAIGLVQSGSLKTWNAPNPSEVTPAISAADLQPEQITAERLAADPKLVHKLIPAAYPLPPAPPGSPKLRVYSWLNPNWGKAFPRIQTALRDYAPPWVEWVHRPQDANVQLLHMLDSRDLAQIRLSDRLVVIQHVTITCMDMKPPAMIELWKRALLVASFHNLAAMVAKYAPFDQPHIRLHTMPWGADAKQFPARTSDISKSGYIVITGEDGGSETHMEVVTAASSAKLKVVHTGNGDPLKDWCGIHPSKCTGYRHSPFLIDEEFSKLISEARYVVVLRKEEGFEMLGVEALFSGTRPVVYEAMIETKPYRWYGSHAVRVRESEDPAQVVSQLTKVFLQPPKPISAEEMQEIRDKFSWTTIVPALYERVLQELHMRRLRGKDEQLQKSLMDQALQY